MINILFEDEYLLVLDKPPGLVVTEIPGLLARLDARLAHRLDKDTSGVLLVAKSEEILEKLQAQFKQRIVKKEYLALVHGEVKEAGKIEGDIGRNPGNKEKFTVLAGAREAETEYEPISNFEFLISNFETIFQDFNKIQIRKLERMKYNEFTLVRCFPKTGRTHQIRVHLKYIGHPIVADEKYVGRRMFRLDNRWCVRQFLHAAKIAFRHPITNQWVEFESQLPDDLTNCLKLLESNLSS